MWTLYSDAFEYHNTSIAFTCTIGMTCICRVLLTQCPAPRALKASVSTNNKDKKAEERLQSSSHISPTFKPSRTEIALDNV